MIPNCFVVGAMKAGTTMLYESLNRHDEVFCCPIKEPNHFCSDINQSSFAPYYADELADPLCSTGSNPVHAHASHVDDYDTYIELFKQAKGESVIAEFSTSYLYSSKAAENIFHMNSQARVIIMLRNPIERAFSEYLMNRWIGKESRTFKDAVAYEMKHEDLGWGQKPGLYVEAGLYTKQVARFLAVFPASQVKVLFTDSFASNFQGSMRATCDFLSIPINELVLTQIQANEKKKSKFFLINKVLYMTGLKKKITSIVPNRLKRKLKKFWYSNDTERISMEDKNMMRGYFKEDIIQLEHLLSVDLSHWK
ncbi:MAG: sulfotransferase [Flavobacteriales bacterium]|nr:sulfotransferase [Flavobacteriales bacterium]